MILESLVTTLSHAGTPNIAPMGPRVDPDLRHFTLRPYKTSETYRNLKRHPEGVLHVTDDVLLLAQAAINRIDPPPPTRPATAVHGSILTGACRYYEFRVSRLDDQGDPTSIDVEVLATGRLRDFFGFNRAKHAVVEAAILATRIDFLPIDDILAELRRLRVPVEKTGGDQEHQAFHLLTAYVEEAQRSHPNARPQPVT